MARALTALTPKSDSLGILDALDFSGFTSASMKDYEELFYLMSPSSAVLEKKMVIAGAQSGELEPIPIRGLDAPGLMPAFALADF